MRKMLALVALLVVAAPVCADEGPSLAATTAATTSVPPAFRLPTEEYVYLAAASADMLTTLDIKNHPNLQEENPILGPHPSDGKVITYFTVTDLAHAAITYEMVEHGVSPKFIKAWEYISIGVEGGFAVHNVRLGLHFAL